MVHALGQSRVFLDEGKIKLMVDKPLAITSCPVTKEKSTTFFLQLLFIYLETAVHIEHLSDSNALVTQPFLRGYAFIRSHGGNESLFHHCFLVLVCATSSQVHKKLSGKIQG